MTYEKYAYLPHNKTEKSISTNRQVGDEKKYKVKSMSSHIKRIFSSPSKHLKLNTTREQKIIWVNKQEENDGMKKEKNESKILSLSIGIFYHGCAYEKQLLTEEKICKDVE